MLPPHHCEVWACNVKAKRWYLKRGACMLDREIVEEKASVHGSGVANILSSTQNIFWYIHNRPITIAYSAVSAAYEAH